MFKTVPRFVDEKKVDFDILMPIIILHDVGYSKVKKGSNPFNLKIRKFHSEEGAKIAEQILIKLGYPTDKIAKIKTLILKHDDWAFGSSFENEPFLKIFNNFDFMWLATKKDLTLPESL